MVARAAFGADYFDGGGVDNRAEARIVRGLEKNGPSTVPNGAAVGQHKEVASGIKENGKNG